MIIYQCDFCGNTTPNNGEMYSLSIFGTSRKMTLPDYDGDMICQKCLMKIKEEKEDEE